MFNERSIRSIGLIFVALFVFPQTTNGEVWAQNTANARGKALSARGVNNYASEIIVWKVEKKVGHRLNWKRRQSIRDNAKIMNDTIDKANKELSGHLQKAFHLSQTQVDSLNSRLIKGRVYGNSSLLKGRISGLRKKPLNKYESDEVDRLVQNRDRVQKKAREDMARTISGTMGLSYQDCLALVQPAQRRINGASRKSNSLDRTTIYENLRKRYKNATGQ